MAEFGQRIGGLEGKIFRTVNDATQKLEEAGGAIRHSVETAGQTLVEIVHPPYNTPDGRPLSVHHYYSGKDLTVKK